MSTIKKVLKIKPKEYLQQGMRYCGGYDIKAVLSAYDLDDGRHPKNYLPTILKSLGFMTPKIIKDVLRNYRLRVNVKRANNLLDNKKLEAIKKELDKNHPVILLIGNGYSPKGKYSWIKQQLTSHWISIWGYNDKEKIFYVYDSFVDKNSYDRIPVGNVKRTYEQVLRDWRGSFYFRHINFLYISVSK